MKTILDVTVCTHSQGGVGRWIKGLSRGLGQVSSEHISLDVPETHSGVACTVKNAASLQPPGWMSIPLLRRYLLRLGWLEKSRSRRISRSFGIPDVIHLSGVQPFGSARRKVVTFFDDTPWTDPDSHTRDTLFYAGRMAKLVENGAFILTISKWSSERAVSVFGVSPSRIGYAGGAADEIFQPGEPDCDVMSRFGVEAGKYYLHVGSYVPRKNIPFLINCFHRSGIGQRKLVLVGAEKWGDQDSADHDQLAENVIMLQNVPDSDLVELYRGAEAVLLPSSEEGLGLPVLEALACNTPVVVSDGGALPETVGDSGVILPVLHEGEWIDALATGATDEMRSLAQKRKRITWRDVAEKALQFYRDIS